MVFAFNCVTVLLLLLELTRFFLKDTVPLVRNTLEKFFKNYCDQREKGPNALIITHILLLMG